MKNTVKKIIVITSFILLFIIMAPSPCWGQPKEGTLTPAQQLNAMAHIISGIVNDQVARDRMEEAAQCKDEEHVRRMLLSFTIVRGRALDLRNMAWARHDALSPDKDDAAWSRAHDAFTHAMERFDGLIEEIDANLSVLRECNDANSHSIRPCV